MNEYFTRDEYIRRNDMSSYSTARVGHVWLTKNNESMWYTNVHVKLEIVRFGFVI